MELLECLDNSSGVETCGVLVIITLPRPQLFLALWVGTPLTLNRPSLANNSIRQWDMLSPYHARNNSLGIRSQREPLTMGIF